MPEVYPVVAKPIAAEYLTPNLDDFVTYIRVDRKKPDYEQPAVGSAYPITGDTLLDAKFAGFKFATLKPDGEGTEFVLWFYVKDRANEDAYNYEIQYFYSSERYPSYIRTYVVLRSAYVQPAIGSADPVHPEAVLVHPDKVVRSDNRVIDSMYVLVQRRYDVIPNLAVTADLNDLKTFGYKVTFPCGSLTYPRVEWKVKCNGYTPDEPLSVTCPVTGYTTLKLIEQIILEEEKDEVTDLLRIYEKVPGPAIPATRTSDGRAIVAITEQPIDVSGYVASAPAGGIIRETQAIDCFRSMLATRTLVAGTRSWTTREYVRIPRVLRVFHLYPFIAKSATPDSPVTLNVVSIGAWIILEDYSKEYTVTYNEEWRDTPYTGLASSAPHPTSITWTSPFGSGVVPECLHGLQTVVVSTGTNHPTYTPLVGVFDYPQTDNGDLFGASGIVTLTDKQEPYNGGWLRTTRTMTKLAIPLDDVGNPVFV